MATDGSFLQKSTPKKMGDHDEKAAGFVLLDGLVVEHQGWICIRGWLGYTLMVGCATHPAEKQADLIVFLPMVHTDDDY
jgi:hypothetical protein